jgi:hypothetical protein
MEKSIKPINYQKLMVERDLDTMDKVLRNLRRKSRILEENVML